MLKKGLISLLILLVVACLCASVLVVPAVGWAAWNKSALQTVSTTAAVVETSLPTLEPEIKGTPQPTDTVGAETAGQMDEIQKQVVKLRNLSQLKPFTRAMLSTHELKQKVKEEFFKNYTKQQINDDALLYTSLGLLKPGSDLLGIYQDLYSEQVAGYYDPESKEMYVVKESGFNGTERMTYSHEFTHTLQDQHYDLRGKLKIEDSYCRQHAQYCSAVTALVEGDAVSSEESWFYTYATDLDRKQVQSFYGSYSSPVYDSSPEFIKEDLLFPYQQGFEFVQTLYDKGGWDAVDAAYANPPQTTEQIMHPTLYPDAKEVEVPRPELKETPGSDWRIASEGNLGEWYTYLLLSKGWNDGVRLSSSEGLKAAAGWGGDHYVLYQKIKEPSVYILAVDWKWDTLNDADQFWSALSDLCQKRWGKPVIESALDEEWENENGSRVSIRYTNLGTRWIVASSEEGYDLSSPDLTVYNLGEK
jgi:hypothetical protein